MVGQLNMRRIMGNKITSTSTRQEHRTVAGAMLLVLILSLVCAQWLSHYRSTISKHRFSPDLDERELFADLKTHKIDTLKLQLPPHWKQLPRQDSDTYPGVVQEVSFVSGEAPETKLHVFELNVGQTQDPQSIVYAGIRQAIATRDLSTLTIAHEWANRRANRMQRRMLAVSRADGHPVFHHLMIWSHDGRSYWVFYTSEISTELSVNSARLARFDKYASSLAMLAQDTRFTLATAEDCANRQLGFSEALSDVYATCDPQSPSTLLLYPDVLDGFYVIRVARSAQLDTTSLEQALNWQFQATMRRMPTDAQRVKDQTLPDTDWYTLHYPTEKDMGIGPEPLSRDVHVIRPPEGVTLTVEVTGHADVVKQIATRIGKLVEPLSKMAGDFASENDARQRGRQLVDHAIDHLDHAIHSERNLYTIAMANQLVGYQLETITREDKQWASGSVHLVFPSPNTDASIDHHWKIDFAQRSFISATEDQTSDGKIKKRSLAIASGQINCHSDKLEYEVTGATDIPWPVSEDYWPVKWLTDQDMLGKWMLVRTVYSTSPPTWHWVILEKTSQGYRVLRRPIFCVDTNVYMLDEKGNFMSLDGYDFEAAAHSTFALSVHRVDADTVYNHWPAKKSDIAKWITDHETSDR